MSPRQLLSADLRKRKIVEAATALFARHGFAGTTSAALARACGVSEALIYKLFESKQGLHDAIIEHKLETWLPLEIDPGSGALEDVLTSLAEQVFARVAEDPDFVRLMSYADLQESAFVQRFAEARGVSCVQEIGDHLAKRVAAGELRADLDVYLVAGAFLGQVWHYATGIKVHGRGACYPTADDATAIRTMVAIFVRGLAK